MNSNNPTVSSHIDDFFNISINLSLFRCNQPAKFLAYRSGRPRILGMCLSYHFFRKMFIYFDLEQLNAADSYKAEIGRMDRHDMKHLSSPELLEESVKSK